jgi:hypothetical protein
MGIREGDKQRYCSCGRPIVKNAKRCARCAHSGHTPEQRDKHPLCGANKRSGGICRAFAGQGTDHPGTGRCKFHGGSTPNGKKNAVAIEAKAAMVTMGTPLDGLLPHDALLGLLRATAGHVGWVWVQIGELSKAELGTHHGQVLMRLYDDERDRLVRIGDACIRAGIAEELVRVEQRQIMVLGTCLSEAATAAGLSEQQKQTLGRELRDAIARYEADSGGPASPFLATA